LRQWNVNSKLLCRKHLLGEHVELHMFVACLNLKRSIKKYIETGLVEVHTIQKRHEELVEEMKRRGYNHQSPLPIFSPVFVGKINVEQNEKELARRCESCRNRIGERYDATG